MASYVNGTFTNRRVTMGFLNHGGMWGDLIIMSTASGIMFPYANKIWTVVLPVTCIAVGVTIVAHMQWAKWSRNDGVTEHVFPTHETGKWYQDISVAGWMHAIVMTALLSLTLLYAVSPAPRSVVLAASLLITVQVFLGLVQPGWYCTRKLWTWRHFGLPVFITALIWIVALLKLQAAKPSL